MTKVRFADQNEWTKSTVTLTASSEATGYPVSYLLSSAPWKKWRSVAGTTDQWVKCNRVSSTGITCALLKGWRAFLSGGTIKVQFNSSDSWASPAFESSFTLPAVNTTGVVALWFSSRSDAWIRFLFTNPGAVNDYVELGVAFVGPYLEPAVTITDDVGFNRVDPSIVRRAINGQESAVSRPHYFLLDARSEYLGTTDKTNLLSLYERVGQLHPLFVAADGDDADQIVYGRLAGEYPFRHITRNQWALSLALAESR